MEGQHHTWTATEAVRAISENTLTVEDYARSLLRRVNARNAKVQAWEHLDSESIIATAKKLDGIKEQDRGVLHGVSVGIKDIIATSNYPTKYNSPIYETHMPSIDAACVKILERAGALIMGKTTTTEFAISNKCPKTRNPHDITRTPGGSSSGSAAAVADFQTAIALGTQTGGSIIRPASFVGCYAMKPTWNALTREDAKICSLILDTLGFFARSIDDLQLMLRVFQIEDDVPPSPTASVESLKVAYLKTMIWVQAGSGTRTAMSTAVARLQDAGASVQEIELPPEFTSILDWHRTIVQWDTAMGYKWEYTIAPEKLDLSIRDLVAGKHGITKKKYLEALDGIAALRPKWDAIAEEFAAVIVPSAPDVASAWDDGTGNWNFQAIWTALHVPVVHIPAFYGENNLPIGLSLVTSRFKDQALLSVGKAIDQVWQGKVVEVTA